MTLEDKSAIASTTPSPSSENTPINITPNQSRILDSIGRIWQELYLISKLDDAIATGVVKSWLIRQEKGIKYGKRY